MYQIDRDRLLRLGPVPCRPSRQPRRSCPREVPLIALDRRALLHAIAGLLQVFDPRPVLAHIPVHLDPDTHPNTPSRGHALAAGQALLDDFPMYADSPFLGQVVQGSLPRRYIDLFRLDHPRPLHYRYRHFNTAYISDYQYEALTQQEARCHCSVPCWNHVREPS